MKIDLNNFSRLRLTPKAEAEAINPSPRKREKQISMSYGKPAYGKKLSKLYYKTKSIVAYQ